MQLGSAFVHDFDIFLLRHNYVIYLLDQITFFDDVRITLYFDMFELHMEITLQLCFVFARHCEVFLLCYNYVIFVRCSYVWITFGNNFTVTLYLCSSFWCNFITSQWRSFITSQLPIYLFDVVTFFDNVRITLYFGTFALRIEITLQLRFVFARHYDVFFITSQLRYLFVPCSYVFWWR